MLAPTKTVDEDARLEGLAALRIVGTPREERFDRVVRLAVRALGTPMAALSFVERGREWFKSGHGWAARELPRRDSLGAHALGGTGAFVVEDLRRDPRFLDHPLAAGPGGLRFYAAVPVRAPDGGNVGVLALMDRHPRCLDRQALALLTDLGYLVEDELAARCASMGGDREATDLRAMLDAVGEPAALLDVEARILHCGRAWRSLARPGDLMAPEDAPGVDLARRLEGMRGLLAGEALRLAQAIRQAGLGQQERFSMEYEVPGGPCRRAVVEAVEVWGSRRLVVRHVDRTDAVRGTAAQDALQDAGVALAGATARLESLRRRLVEEVHAAGTPLTPIRVHAELLLRQRLGPLSRRQRRSLGAVVRNVERSIAIAGRLEALALDAGAGDGERQRVDAGDVAHAAVAGARTAYMKAGISLVAHSDGPAWAAARPGVLREMLDTLLARALSVTPAGGRVVVAVHREARGATVEVRDGGPGSAAPDPAQGAAAFAVEWCRRAVEAMGGSLVVEGDGSGTCVQVRLAPAPAV